MKRPGEDNGMPDLNPDFRQMSEKDLRRGISELNRSIKRLKTDYERHDSEIHDLVSLRAKFKAVWRARPGRPFHDVAARKKREDARRRGDGPGFIFPFMP